jgi:uncharacterized protein YyaL (SSP411 family)
MLYDNSQLARVYLHAWQVTGNVFFRTITEEILDYVMREMLDPAGGSYSTQDADSEGEEGKFFVWTPTEIRNILRDRADHFMAAYGVTQHGNFEGKNILEFIGDLDQRPVLAEARRKLFKAREHRVHPGRDDVQLAQAPTTEQCRRHRRRHCQGPDLVERPDAGRLCRGGLDARSRGRFACARRKLPRDR